MSSYSELIKNFEKIRSYIREFYVYGSEKFCSSDVMSILDTKAFKVSLCSLFSAFNNIEYA